MAWEVITRTQLAERVPRTPKGCSQTDKVFPKEASLIIEADERHDAALTDLTAEGQLLEVVSVDRPWGQQNEFKNAPPTLAAYFALMLQHSDKTFLVFQNERYSFQEVWDRSNNLAGALQAEGIKAGDRIVIAMRNYPEWIFAFIGTRTWVKPHHSR